MDAKTRILNFIAEGYKAVHIASITGFSASYISQVLKEPEAQEYILKLKEESPTRSNDEILATRYEGVEHSLLNNIEKAMEFAELPALVRALEVVGNRQEKRALRLLPQIAPVTNVNVLQLTLPSHATLNLPSYQLNENKEVIAIAGKEMAPLSSDGVKGLFDRRSNRFPIDTVADF